MDSSPSRFQMIAVGAAILVAGVGAGGWTYHRGKARERAGVQSDAKRCAAAFSADELRTLSASRDDLASPVYAATKARLVALKKAQPGVRYLYLVRHQAGTGEEVLLADSTDVVQPGEAFGKSPEAEEGNGAHAVMTAYAPVGPEAADGAQTADVLGIDEADDFWSGALPWRMAGSAVYVWLLLGVPAGLLLAGRRGGPDGAAASGAASTTDPETGGAEVDAKKRGEFLATLGHELRTPLNGIVRYAGLLLDTPLVAEQRSHVQTISSNGEALLKLTGNLLDYSWLESGRMPLDPQPCDVRELIEGVLDLMSSQAAAKDLVLLHRVAREVPALVEIDGGRLRQVLVNLLGNAVKFTSAGEVSVEAYLRPEGPSEGGVFLEFKVRDTGPGIAEADQGRLFQPFSQISLAVGRRHGGTGLGLVISRSLVRLMGGEITLASTPGEGTVFGFHVAARPLESQAMAPALAGRRVALVVGHAGLRDELVAVVCAAGGMAEPRTPEQLAGADLVVVDCDINVTGRVTKAPPGGIPWPVGRTLGLIPDSLGTDERKALRPLFRLLVTKPLHHEALVSALKSCRAGGGEPVARVHPQLGAKLLLVDDNPANLRLLQGIVGVLGCECTVADGGQAGFDAIARGGRYDAVLLDLQMPDVDGIEVMRRLRDGEAGAEARDLWVTIVTADARSETRSSLFALGCDDFITKPVTVKSCLAALQRVAGNRPARA